MPFQLAIQLFRWGVGAMGQPQSRTPLEKERIEEEEDDKNVVQESSEEEELSDCGSVAGDTDTDADASTVAARRAPLGPARKSSTDERPPSSKWNSEAEVGNIGIFWGNWGGTGEPRRTESRERARRPTTNKFANTLRM